MANAQSCLMGIPPELRLRIYNHLVVFSCTLTTDEDRKEIPDELYYDEHTLQLPFREPAIARTNRQIRKEVLPVLVGANTIKDGFDDPYCCHLLARLNAVAVPCIRSLHVGCYARAVETSPGSHVYEFQLPVRRMSGCPRQATRDLNRIKSFLKGFGLKPESIKAQVEYVQKRDKEGKVIELGWEWTSKPKEDICDEGRCRSSNHLTS